jgi:hypothetical protein
MAAFIGRRQFITLLGGAAAAWPLAAGAQQAERVRRIGVLMGIANDSEGQARMAVFRKTMESLGWIEGRNLQLDYRWAPIAAPQARVFAEELVQQKPDLIFCLSTSVTMAVRNAAATIPVVFVQVTDPMSAGLVQNWAKPGGNLTGFTNFEPSMSGKWLELLRTLVPGMTRVAIRDVDSIRHQPAFDCIYIPSGRNIRRSHPARHSARRSAGAGADKTRTDNQPQDREGARARSATNTARPRRRGNRMNRLR